MQGTKILTDEQEIVDCIRQFQANTRKFWGACVDSTLPSFSVGKVRDGYAAAKKRGVRIMYITEVTEENLPYCKEIMKFAELRHLDGVKGNFAVSDTEYVAGDKRGDSIRRLVYSNEKELVLQQRHVFFTLWRHSAPAGKRLESL